MYLLVHLNLILMRVSGARTAVEMSLLSNLVVRVTVRVNRTVQLLERHESRNELIVSVEKATKPLLGFNMVNLPNR